MTTASSAAPLNPSAAPALASLERRMNVCCYDSIRKTPDERIREHADALAFAETLREAKLNPHVAV